MAVNTTYPGVYVTEIPSGVRPITGVATSITAFVGATVRGPANKPTVINGFADFERIFGGLSQASTVSFAVLQFFLNGGSQAVIVRLATGTPATIDAGGLALVAASPGTWSDGLKVTVGPGSDDAAVAQRVGVPAADLFTLVVTDASNGSAETFSNVSIQQASSRYVGHVLDEESTLVRLQGAAAPGALPTPGSYGVKQAGTDGATLSDNDYMGPGTQLAHNGIYALEDIDLFNILCIPPPTLTDGDATTAAVYQAGLKYCVDRRAILIVDPPSRLTKDTAAHEITALGLSGTDARNAALYFPRILAPDPTSQNRLRRFVPCGAIAGVMARTDASRGVWKAPAGIDASVNGTSDLEVNLTDAENGQLNPLGVNCLRTFRVFGRVVWGARTLRGADMLADEYKYLPVRRLALFIEESLYRGTQWVVFEPNDEPLWAQIRLNLGAFMQNLFRQGAFEGKKPQDAYFVKCDGETTTANDRNLGRVNIVVGFAPLKPAEFVVLQIQQIARAEA